MFSGRAGRSIATDYVRAAIDVAAPEPAPYPVQRALTAPMRREAINDDSARRLQAWAGQSAALSSVIPAGDFLRSTWEAAAKILE